MKRYTESHEWTMLDGDEAIIGITDFAQNELGDIVHIELPKVGSVIEAGEEIAVVESTKAAADIYAPVSGEIILVNELLLKSPELINESPEENGWICKIKGVKETEYKMLLEDGAYQELIS